MLDPYLDNRLRSDKPITFLGFIDDLRKMWRAAGKLGKIIRNKPKDDAEFPAITYRVIRRLINQDMKDIKPRYRSTILHPYMPNTYVELWGQSFDVWVEFTILSEDAEQADEIVIEFEDFIHIYKGFFKKNGVQEILFYAQGEDEVDTQTFRFPVHKRAVQYTMRFEKVTPVFMNQIHQIAVQAEVIQEEELMDERAKAFFSRTNDPKLDAQFIRYFNKSQ